MTPETGQSSFLTCKSGGETWFELEKGEAVDRRTSVAHARAVHLDKTFTGLQLVRLLDGMIFADFDRGSWPGDNGSGLNLRDRHRGSGASLRVEERWRDDDPSPALYTFGPEGSMISVLSYAMVVIASRSSLSRL